MHLTPHPESLAPAISIEVELERGASGALRLKYVVRGSVGGISFPMAAGPGRTDGLWQHTCFEAFLREAEGDAYYEFNFSPSKQWAAYRFDGYRAGMCNADVPAPAIAARQDEGTFELVAALTLPCEGPCQLGLSAVIEEQGGRKSYWALAHPRGKPDFHNRACFALELPPAVAP